ncbi:unnamed protein product [Cyprideis torosa]|uniref:Uncharacterized protein n=1 Tax=Cyprideis torosa TaxID=163714 RepID=A0A7R8WB80_9CRUS|nr:unnamed protein product [Cyprideis torosa]CAG0892012.1 unnamed protein product [Cyprideis torosa]
MNLLHGIPVTLILLLATPRNAAGAFDFAKIIDLLDCLKDIFLTVANSPGAIEFTIEKSGIEHEIFYGEKAQEGEFPYHATLLYPDGKGHYCGGSIIAQKWILTAAHCVDDKPLPQVVVGTVNLDNLENATIMNVRRKVLHPEYRNLEADFALLELTEDLEYSEYIQPITLANKEDDPEQYSNCVVTGSGRTENGTPSGHLLYAKMNYEEDKLCSEEVYYPFYNPKWCICVRNPKAAQIDCKGDSGGPWVCGTSQKKQFGIVSYGEGDCDLNYPSVYADVREAKLWIQETCGDCQKE